MNENISFLVTCPYCGNKGYLSFHFELVGSFPIRSVDCTDCRKSFHAEASLEKNVKCYEATFIEYD